MTTRTVFETVAETEIARDIERADNVMHLLHDIAVVMKARTRPLQEHHVVRVVLAVHENRDDPIFAKDRVIRNTETQIEIEFRRGGDIWHEHLIMIHAQRTSTFMSVRPRLRTDVGRLGRHQLQRRAGGVAHVQRTALKWDVDEAGFDANTVEMRLGLDEVVIGEHTKPDAFAYSLALGLLQCQAVMASLLHAMQPDRVVRLVADNKPNDLGVERAAQPRDRAP